MRRFEMSNNFNIPTVQMPKLSEILTKVYVTSCPRPADFGAVGDGITDDSKALQAYYDHVINSEEGFKEKVKALSEAHDKAYPAVGHKSNSEEEFKEKMWHRKKRFEKFGRVCQERYSYRVRHNYPWTKKECEWLLNSYNSGRYNPNEITACLGRTHMEVYNRLVELGRLKIFNQKYYDQTSGLVFCTGTGQDLSFKDLERMERTDAAHYRQKDGYVLNKLIQPLFESTMVELGAVHTKFEHRSLHPPQPTTSEAWYDQERMLRFDELGCKDQGGVVSYGPEPKAVKPNVLPACSGLMVIHPSNEIKSRW